MRNRFRYGLYFLYLPLEEIEETAGRLRLLSFDRPGLASVWTRDHGPRDGSPLRPWIDSVLTQAGIDLGGGPVMLLTFPRVLSTRFYPVSFWYCFGADGLLRAVLAEVHNTFRENHDYLLHADGAPLDWSDRPRTMKVFHVSPFIAMDAKYTFLFSEPGETLHVRIDDVAEGSLLLVAEIELQRRSLTDTQLLLTALRYGPMSARAIALILWQAMKLFLKRVRVYHKPDPPENLVSF